MDLIHFPEGKRGRFSYLIERITAASLRLARKRRHSSPKIKLTQR
jgi:hypothetical protein